MSARSLAAKIRRDCGESVEGFYTITDHEIAKLAELKTAYYLKVRDFWWSIKERDVTSLSQGQASWLSTIEVDLEDNWRPKWNAEEGPDEW